MMALSLLLLAAAPADPPPRRVTDLSGVWEIRADPDNVGLQAGWFKLDRAWEPGDWQTIVVPTSFETRLGVDFDGVAWYRTAVRITPDQAGRRLRLRFRGVATAATVWLDGVELGGHLGAWTPFEFDVTDRLRPGEAAELIVRVDEKVGHNTQGFLPIVAPHFGGLWQTVELIDTAGAWMDDLALHACGSYQREAPLLVRAELEATVPVAGPPAGATLQLQLQGLGAPGEFIGDTTVPAAGETTWRWTGNLSYSVDSPLVRPLHLTLRDGERVLDQITVPVGFRTVTTDGPRILLNGQPLQVRGVLNWGYNAPALDPNLDPRRFREQLRYLQECGFNLIKFCLWVPPTELLKICDEEGMLVWMEYPTWHPTLDQAHKPELLREYTELLQHDRNHACVILRSLTCETGPTADLDVIQALYDLCKRMAPGTLVVDDSSWIGWNRIHDLWDDHSYGNNRWWRGQLARLQAHIDEHGVKPLLLGEAIAADTWPDTRWLQEQCVGGKPWWLPRWFEAQLAFERDLRARFSRPGYDPVEDLREWSLEYALAMRRWQIETFREVLPDAGYVVSVMRDVRLCSMGLFGYDGAAKWSPDDWSWHSEAASTPAPGDQRAYPASAGLPEWAESAERTFALPDPAPVAPGTVLHGPPGPLADLFAGANPLPADAPIPAGTPLVLTGALSRPVLDYLEAGGRVLHLISDLPGSWRAEGTWWLRGTVWTPPEPTAFFDRVPGDMLRYLQLFELGGNTCLRGEALWDQVDPLVAFLETHDIETVRPNLLLFETGVGQGRLMVSGLRHDAADGPNYAGLWLARELGRYLIDGPPPTRRLGDEVREALRTALDAEVLKITAPWRFVTDPDGDGLARRFEAADFDDAGWRELTARSPEEGAIWNAYDGWGWYRQRVPIPAGWAGKRLRLVFDSVDDMYELYLNGRLVGGHGKMDRSETSFLQRTWQDITAHAVPGEENLITVRVYDWVGAGGLNGEVWLTTGPVEPGLDFLRR